MESWADYGTRRTPSECRSPHGTNWVPESDTVPSPKSGRRNLFAGAIATTLALVVLGLATNTSGSRWLHSAGFASTSAPKELSVVLTNEYTAEHGYPGRLYRFFDPELVIEPMRVTTLTAVLNSDGLELKSCEWDIKDARISVSDKDVYAKSYASDPWFGSPTLLDSTSGLSINAQVASPGQYSLAVACTLSDESLLIAEKQLSAYYVRREIRTLTDEDREHFLEAMAQIYYCDEETEAALGGNFHCAQYFTMYHLTSAGARHVDHFHDGLGFLPQHIAMTNAFELALQQVDPSVAIPYWDFTIDSIQIREHGDLESWLFEDSAVFSEKWFGRTSRKDHRISDGLFANLTVPMASTFMDIHSPYGFMRAPWNLNPSPFVTRYHTMCGVKSAGPVHEFEWPTCGTHYRLIFDDVNEEWGWFSMDSLYAPHGPVHLWIGGVSEDSCKQKTNTLSSIVSASDVQNLREYTFVLLKNLYRAGWLNFPTSCSVANQDDCIFHCARNSSAHHYVSNTTAQYGNITAVMRYELELIGIETSSISDAEIEELTDILICDNLYWPGDQLEAGSPSDPAFWPIHPTMERLLQFKVLAKPFTNLTWHWAGSTCLYYEDSDCRGHNAYDVTTFATVKYNSDSNGFESTYLTNVETRDSTFPDKTTYSVPYIYDTFNWEHCEHEGWDFTRSHD